MRPPPAVSAPGRMNRGTELALVPEASRSQVVTMEQFLQLMGGTSARLADNPVGGGARVDYELASLDEGLLSFSLPHSRQLVSLRHNPAHYDIAGSNGY